MQVPSSIFNIVFDFIDKKLLQTQNWKLLTYCKSIWGLDLQASSKFVARILLVFDKRFFVNIVSDTKFYAALASCNIPQLTNSGWFLKMWLQIPQTEPQ